MKKQFVASLLLVVCSVCFTTAMAQGEGKPIYLNTAYSFKERAVDLVSRMTLEEKQTQLGNTMPPIPRLGINKYDFWGEALHGIMGRNDNANMTATSFPNSVAVGMTWDPELIRRETEVIGNEARGFNHDIIFTLTYWSPVVEPARDPRWGRTAETFGEDPYHVAQISSGFIRGMMGDNEKYLKAVPCGKHFFANNAEYNRHSGSADMDDRDMREFYLFPYKALIEKDKLPSIMTAYNAVNGVPMSASKFLVDTIAKRTYGLDGYVTGDCDAVADVVNNHRFAKSRPEAAAMGLKTGVDTDCGSIYQANALEALKQGLITEADIDRALVNSFTIRMRLGEFDPKTIVPYAGIKPSIINDPSHNDLALEIAEKAIVLLKNDASTKTSKKLLPFNTASIKKIAVLGPHANKVELGDYSGEPEAKYRISPLDGLKNYISANKLNIEVVSRESGNTARRTDFLSIRGFTTVHKGETKDYDAVKFDDSSSGLITSGRGGASIRGIKDGDWTAYNNINLTNLDTIRLNASASGAGGLIEIRVGSKTGNILATQKLEAPARPAGGGPGGMGGFGGGMGGFGGMGGGRPSAGISVKINTLGITGPQTVVFVYREAEPPATDKEILDLAASADVALLFVGTDQSTGREESDRFDIKLPGNQNELINAVAAVNPNTIVIIQGMGMVEVEQFKQNKNIPGMIFVGYNGQAQGTAMANVLFGDVNPGGKSSLTWYKSIDDLNDLNDYTLRGGSNKNGRTYMYFTKDVSYEFGYGMSYTTFEYSNFAIDKTAITPNDKVTVSVDVKNAGQVDGDEVVQIYVKTPDSPASLERPIKRLRGFKRVTIPAGQTKRVSIEVDGSDLWFWDAKNDRITFDKGNYVFEIGASSKDIRGTVKATMSGEFKSELKLVVIEADKLVIKPGSTMNTSVTAAMTDDSFADLKKAKVVYTSNNPKVVSIDANGKVTATGVGVALLTASVTVNGKTVSGSTPVKVMPDLTPKSILIDGKPVSGFDKEVKAYSFLMAANAKLPKITATAVSAGVKVIIEQATSIPGTTVVKFLDEISQEKNIYYFNYDVASLSDEFDGTLGKQWQWVRPNPAKNSLTLKTGTMTITSEVGDVSEGTNDAKNLLLQSANTDWTIDTKLVVSRNPSQPENAGIIAYQDDDNFVKFVLRAQSKTTQLRRAPGDEETRPGTLDLIIEENGIAKSFGSMNLRAAAMGESHLYLRLVKQQDVYTAYYSTDGAKFERLTSGKSLLKDIKAGLIVCDGIIIQGLKSIFYYDGDTTKPAAPFNASFDYFHISNTK